MISEGGGESDKKGERHPPQKPPAIIRIFRALKRRYHRTKKRQTEHQKNERMMARWTRRVGVFTVILAAAAIASAVIFYRQQTIMQGQLDEMQAQRRAWLSLTITPRNGFVITDKGAEMVFDVAVTNHGQSPALEAVANSRIYAVPPSGRTRDYRYSAFGECSSKVRSLLGRTIFPGETIKLDQQVLFVGKSAIIGNAENGKVVFIIDVCVDYQSALDSAPRKTAAAYVLARHWFPTYDHGLVRAQTGRYDFNAAGDLAVIDFDRLGAGERTE